MATATQRKRLHESSSGNAPNQAPRRVSRRPWILFAGVLVPLLVTIWLLPIVVAHSPLLNWVVARAASDLKGKVAVQSASLGWFSPPTLGGIDIRDPKGQPVMAIESFSADRWLLGMAWNVKKLGHLRLEKPILTLVVRDDGTNLEDVLAKYLASSTSFSPTADTTIEIVDGQIDIQQLRTGMTWRTEKVRLLCTIPADHSKPMELRAQGVVADRKHPGPFEVSCKIYSSAKEASGKPAAASPGVTTSAKSPAEAVAAAPSDQYTLWAENLPLAMLEPLLARYAPGTHMTGRLSASIQGAADGSLDNLRVEGAVTAEEFRMATPLLGTDKLVLTRLEAGCQLAWQDRRLQMRRLTTHSDLGDLSAIGTLDLGVKSGEPWYAGLAKQAFEVRGNVELAKLAAILPSTLRIRKETQITAGQVVVTLASRPDAQGAVWSGRLDANQLAAVNQGQTIVWQQPLQVVLAARCLPQGPVVDSLKCESSFFHFDASGTPDQFTASANVDLNQLAAQLAGFVDLSGTQMAGSGTANLQWKRTPERRFDSAAQLHVQGFQLATPERPAWVEPQLQLELTASGQTDLSIHSRLDAAKLDLVTGQDHSEVRLVQPILDLGGAEAWPLAIRSQGELSRWRPRLSPWLPLAAWNAAGAYDVQAQVLANSQAVSVESARFAADQFRLQGPGLNVEEPRCELAVAGRLDLTQRRIDLKSARLTTSALAVQGDGLVAAWPPNGKTELSGVVNCQGNLDRLQSWFTDHALPAKWRIAGQVVSQTELRQSDGIIRAKTGTAIHGLMVAHPSGQQFQEPEVQLTGQGEYDIAKKTLVLQQAQITSGTVAGGVTGRLTGSGAASDASLDGRVDYDLERVSALASACLGPGIQAGGRGNCQVKYQGPLSPLTGQGGVTLGWQWADFYGFQVGPGEIQAQLANGSLVPRPLDLAVSEGRVHLAPELRLTNGPALVHGPGRVAEQIRINPQMCANGLEYLAPVLAGVAAAEGRFSIDLESCRIPLSNPAQGEVLGRMTIHSAQIGPGPLVAELAVALGRAGPVEIRRESVIAFRMADGRVYHQGMELVFPDLTIRTQGWVAFDQSLSIMAEMTVPPKWLENNPMAGSLRTQMVRLPIGGTLQRPTIDRKVLADTSAQFIRNAAANVIQDQLNRLFVRPQ